MGNDDQDTIVDMSFAIEDVYLTYKSVCVHLEKWTGGEPAEQERLYMLKDFLYRIILEYKFREL